MVELPELREHTNDIASYLHEKYCTPYRKNYWSLTHSERKKWKRSALQLIEMLEDLK